MAIGHGKPTGQVYGFYLPAVNNLANVQGVDFPFSQTYWPAATFIKSVPAFSDQGIWSLTIPFNQTIWLGVNSVAAIPTWNAPYNVNLYSSNVPFNQTDWPRVTPIRLSTSFGDQGIWALTIPFNQGQWPNTNAVVAIPTWNAPYNINLYPTVVSSPFAKTDWAAASSIKGASLRQRENFLPLIANLGPFVGSFGPVKPPNIVSPQPQPYNPNLYTAAFIQPPFSQTSWLSVAQPRPSYGFSDQAIWALISPFVPYFDASKPFFPIPSKPQVLGANLNLFPAAGTPFTPYDFSRPLNRPSFTPPFIDGALIDVTVPFNQYDWSKPQQPAPAKDQPLWSLNINLYPPGPAQKPFAQYDWPRVNAVRLSAAFSDQGIWALTSPFVPYYFNPIAKPFPSVMRTEGVNIALTAPFVQPPFAQTDWPNTKTVKSSPPQAQPYNMGLFTNPIPFAQYSWPLVSKPAPAKLHDIPNFQVLFQPAPPPIAPVFDPFVHEDIWRKYKKRLRELEAARLSRERAEDRAREVKRAFLRNMVLGITEDAQEVLETKQALSKPDGVVELANSLHAISQAKTNRELEQVALHTKALIAEFHKYIREMQEEEDEILIISEIL
jgi:hypothetical protein